MTNTEPLPAFTCPLCGGDNACAVAASGRTDTPCWCASADFPAPLLDRIPAEHRMRACVCAGCVRGANAAPD